MLKSISGSDGSM